MTISDLQRRQTAEPGSKTPLQKQVARASSEVVVNMVDGTVPRTVFLARIAGFQAGGMGTVGNDFRDREST